MEDNSYYIGNFLIWNKNTTNLLTNIIKNKNFKNSVIKEFCKNLLKCLKLQISNNKNLDHGMIVLAAFLNPSTRNLLSLKETKDAKQRIFEILDLLKENNKNESFVNFETDKTPESNNSEPESDLSFIVNVSNTENRLKRTKKEKKKEFSAEEEIEEFIKDSSQTKNFNSFWKHCILFPRLKKLATIAQAVIASNGQLERMFSLAKYLQEARKNKIDTKLMESRLKSFFN